MKQLTDLSTADGCIGFVFFGAISTSVAISDCQAVSWQDVNYFSILVIHALSSTHLANYRLTALLVTVVSIG